MIRFFRALPALALFAAAVTSYAQTPGRGAQAPISTPGPQAQPSRLLPNVPIKTADTKGINLRKYRGKEIILLLFSTECEDCINTAGYLNKIQQDFGSRGLQVVGVAINENAPYTVTPWAQRYKLAFPVGFLDQEATMKLANFKKDDHPFVPIIMFVDSAGTVRVQYFGNDPVFKSQQEKAFRAIADSLLKWQAARAASAKAAEPKPDTPPPAKPDPNRE
jgi:peroxiredoxin